MKNRLRNINFLTIFFLFSNICFANPIVFKHNNKYGVLDENLDLIIKPENEKIFDSKDGIFSIQFGQVYLYDFNSQSQIKIETNGDYIGNIFYLYDSLYCLVSSQYDFIYDCNDNILSKMPYAKHITRNKNLKELSHIEPLKICSLIGKEFPIEHEVKKYVILDNVRINKVFPFVKNRAVVEVTSNSSFTDSCFMLINSQGEVVLKNVYNCGWQFSDGLLPVISEEGTGFINSNCEFVFNCPLYFEISENHFVEPGLRAMFSDGYAYVRTNENEYKIFDKKGNIIKTLDYSTDAEHGFSEGLLPVKNQNHYGYINIQGEIIIPFIFDEAYDFCNGYAIVKYEQEDCLLDTSGNLFRSNDLIKGKKKRYKNVKYIIGGIS